MNKIRIGIIGAGIIGKIHIEKYSHIEAAEIIAICDINENEAKAVALKYNIPNVYKDFREMLKRDDIIAVDVCLHNNLHAPITLAALDAAKHVYCEKPIAGSYFDGKVMCDRAKKCGKMLHIQLNTLYRKETKAAKALIDEGELGKLYHAQANAYRRRNRPFVDGYGTSLFTRKESATGGALIDLGVYYIGQMLYLLGQPEPIRISGKTYQEMDMDATRRKESGFNVEELALGFVKFAENITLNITSAWSIHLNSFEGSSIVGSKGGIRLPAIHEQVEQTPFTFHTTLADMDFDSTVDLALTDQRWNSLRKNQDAFNSSQEHWIAALQGRVSLLPTADITLKTMLISEGMYMSSDRGEEVSAEEVRETSRSTAITL